MKFYFGRGSALPRLVLAKDGDGDGGASGSQSGGEGEGRGDGDGGSGEGGSWTDSLPDDIRQWDEVSNSEDAAGFWKQMSDMKSHLGTSIRIPGKDAGEEDITKFHAKLQDKVPGLMNTPDFEDDKSLQDLYTRMGRPEKAEDYIVPEFKDSEGEEIPGLDLSLAEAFKDIAHGAGLSQKKYAEIVRAITDINLAKHSELVGKQKEDVLALETEWGAATKQNRDIVSNFVKKSGAPEPIAQAIENKVLSKDTMVWLHQIATKTLSKGDSFQTDNSSSSGVMTPGEAALKISEIRNNKKHAYYNKMDPGHKAAKDLMRKLYLLKDPKHGRDPAPGTNFTVGGSGAGGLD